MQQQRNFGLDLARATAISMVFLSHGVSAMEPLGVGVDLFFLLSGFLIGRIYFRSTAEDDFSLLNFWRSRWWRTLPPYFAALLVYLLFSYRFAGNNVHWYYLAFLQNYVGIDGFGPSWSLCVEEHFYLLLPLLGMMVGRTLGRRSFIWLLPLAALVPEGLRLFYLAKMGGLPTNWYWMSHFHCEGLVIGVLLAYLYVDHQTAWNKLKPLAAVCALIPVLLLVGLKIHPTQSMKLHGSIFLLWAIGFGGWVRVLYDLTWAPQFALSRLVKQSIHGLALCSYSVYLIHTLLFSDIRVLVSDWHRGPAKTVFILGSTLVISVGFYFLVERPTIQTRDAYFKRQRNLLRIQPRADELPAVES